MASLADKVENCLAEDDAYQDRQEIYGFESSRGHPTSPRPPSINLVFEHQPGADSGGFSHTYSSLPNSPSHHSHYGSSSLTPAARTGPPRSLSFSYNHTVSPSFSSPSYINHNDGDILEKPRRSRALTDSGAHDNPYTHDLTPRESQFRGPFDFIPAKQKDREREAADRRGKRRDSSRWDDFKSRWLHDALTSSPGEEISSVDLGKDKERDDADISGVPLSQRVSTAIASGSGSGIGPAHSVSMSTPDKGKEREHQDAQTPGSKSPATGWSRLRFLLPHVASPTAKEPASSALTLGRANITDELIVSGLSHLMLRLWFERDEHGRRRIPILLHRLRIRISDSLHPLHEGQSVFRIECEYANRAMRWVIYRQQRDFVSLHTHYALSNAFNRNIEKLPEFPRTSLPYFKFLKKEGRERGGDVGRAAFARLQRLSLENYLIDLIRSVMFLPTSNRLASFLEISALSIHLAQSGGTQYKAGYLQIAASGNKGAGFGRKSASRAQKRKQRWCAVRESYLVAVEEPGELAVWDVFLLDADFKIEQPTRYYRQGLSLLHGEFARDNDASKSDPTGSTVRSSGNSPQADRKSLLGSIRSRVSHILRPHHDAPHAGPCSGPDGEHESHIRSDTEAESLDPDSRPLTPILDPSTNTNPLNEVVTQAPSHQGGGAQGNKKRRASGEVSKHTFYIENSQMRLKLYARSERQMLQWIAALEKVAATSPFTGSNRFNSFAPIRLNVSAQWLVDGRDYFWNLSRAILLAKDTIYIHDWWLSPELCLRRPGMPKYRLDKLLEKKAKGGVKIFIIVYQEVSSRTTPTDSNYAKQRLATLHPNILVQRSPSHFQTGTFYWAHHEKLCVIDSTIAFMGGLDLCFGRWDTPQHTLVDDPEEGEESIWPGKDYSNARITDFHTLTKPEEDMHDRSKIPRMPWHDVGLQIVGQPARDLGRHFVQRWNYLLRIKNHSRVMPFLVPPSEFKPGELTQLGLTGTCELQICRSAGPWSLGTPDRVEKSIQNAYLKAIQLSEHFVYIENQFFITSTAVGDVAIENKIGDAIVHRIIRAHREGTKWRCCVVIPLFPGFPFPVDHTDASSVRIIMECQNRTIGRGPNSIFSRLHREGIIDPSEYFRVFSLRNWAKLRGDVLTTELVYIHGKVCIVDDRLAIIGSANINERSQRGDRDSELAAVVRDTELIEGKMAGKPFKVGRFAHTLRVRLMREHTGIDVDALEDEDLQVHGVTEGGHEAKAWDPDAEQRHGQEFVTNKIHHAERMKNMMQVVEEAMQHAIHGPEDVDAKPAVQGLSKDGLQREVPDARAADMTLEEERNIHSRDYGRAPGLADTLVPTLEERVVEKHQPATEHTHGTPIEENPEKEEQEKVGNVPADAKVGGGQLFDALVDASSAPETDSQPHHARMGKNDADAEEQKVPRARGVLRKHLNAKSGQSSWTVPTPMPKPKYDADCFEDPICDEFWDDIWVACAEHNTELFRRVFHAVPDDLVTTWKQYKDFVAHHERLLRPLQDSLTPETPARVSSTGRTERPTGEQGLQQEPRVEEAPNKDPSARVTEETETVLTNGQTEGVSTPTEKVNGSAINDKGKKTRGEPSFTKQEREEMEALLGDLCGHLVIYPTRFLEGEDVANNFLFTADRLLPLPIYD